jgi:outer membrane protein OmpA-like peptidoglycan-associated protein
VIESPLTGSLDEGPGPWPALSDLLASTTLIFLVLFAVIAVPALKAKGRWAQTRNTLDAIETTVRRDSFHVRRLGDYLLVTIDGDASFPQRAFELDRLNPSGKDQLVRLARVLSQATLASQIDQIQVVGHTSREGDDETNWRLSSQRASTVALFLIREAKLPACKVTALGRGRYFPVDPAAARRDTMPHPGDRRIEIEIRPSVVGDSAQAKRKNDCVEHPGQP